MGDTKDVAREALASAKFVQLLEFDKEDPTLVYVQPVDKGYWVCIANGFTTYFYENYVVS